METNTMDHDEHGEIVAAAGLGNNGWVFRFRLTPEQRLQADAAVRAGRLCKIWKELFAHPMQQAYALPKVLGVGGPHG